MAKKDLEPPGQNAMHVCLDMQRMFAENTDRGLSGCFPISLPSRLCILSEQSSPDSFHRRQPSKAQILATLLPVLELNDHRPSRSGHGRSRFRARPVRAPARTYDKHVYSPWTGSDLHLRLRKKSVDSIVITGGETDVCLPATALGAIDWGLRVILVTDALCSSADETHDAMMAVYLSRFGEQIECDTTETLIAEWV